MAMTGFKAYRSKGSATRAARIEGDGETFYVVARPGHEVEVVSQGDFEGEFQSTSKGVVKEGSFKNFRKSGGDIKAQVLEAEVTIGGVDYQPGDYMVLDGGELTGATKADFEAKCELVKKNYNKKSSEATPKKKVAKAE